MNILKAPWLPFELKDGTKMTLPMTAIAREDIVDFALPRADFQGAAYQFSIGLLQTVFAPKNKQQWHSYYRQAPSIDSLQTAFDTVAHAFNVTGSGALFMQDFDELKEVLTSPVSGLLIEAPGANALKLNTDHFIKRDVAKVMSIEMAALALFTLQIYAPSGGQGHRTGLRGGGPLTSLLLPQHEQTTLWQKLWINVIFINSLSYCEPNFYDGSVFPWLAATRTSNKKASEVYQADIHYLQMFWPMPRRIRLHVEDGDAVCAISGETSQLLVKNYRTKNYGINYSGNWCHPLTPYRWNPKKTSQDEFSVKGQPGGITYRIWHTLAFSSDQQGQRCAKVVEQFSSLQGELKEADNEQIRLWVFGYDMDNMKARGWYSSEMPLFAVGTDYQEDILHTIIDLQDVAAHILWCCRTQIKAAWFDKPKEVKGDFSFIDLFFWQRTEAIFYHAVQQIIANATSVDKIFEYHQAKDWLNKLRYIALAIFDEQVLMGASTPFVMMRRYKARQLLETIIFYKPTKNLKSFIKNYRIKNQGE